MNALVRLQVVAIGWRDRAFAAEADLAAARAREQRLREALEEIAARGDDSEVVTSPFDIRREFRFVGHPFAFEVARAALAAEPAATLAEPCGAQFTAGRMSLACERPPGHLGEHACPSAVGSVSAPADEPGERA